MSRLQTNDHQGIVQLMDTIGLDYRPEHLGISREVLTESLASLSSYVRRAGLWYSVIDERQMDSEWISSICDSLYET